MAKEPRSKRFQSWLLERMVDTDFTPTSLAIALELLDGEIEGWVAGRSVPTVEECQLLAQIFELPVNRVLEAAGFDPGASAHA
ncbi:MAG: hypothetical protein ACRDIY_06715 [Chloroflexota bacterium]